MTAPSKNRNLKALKRSFQLNSLILFLYLPRAINTNVLRTGSTFFNLRCWRSHRAYEYRHNFASSITLMTAKLRVYSQRIEESHRTNLIANRNFNELCLDSDKRK